MKFGTGLAVAGALEAAANVAGDSVLDRMGDVAVKLSPVPVVEETVKRLGVTDKPIVRAASAAQIAGLVGALAPGTRSAKAELALAGAGVAAIIAGRRHLLRQEAARHAAFALPVSEPLPPAADGAEGWPGVEPLFTEPGRFYQTDINMRSPAVDLASWRLAISGPAGVASLAMDEIVSLGLRERDAVLACVHNRPGWDRLGQQRWTGVPIADVLATAGPLPDDADRWDIVMRAVDGYTQILPLGEATARRSWLVVGMAGEPLPQGHGYPARVMTPGLVGQYNGVKWVEALELVPAGQERAWWVRRGWPVDLVELKPMARIDSPGVTGMPPRLPPKPVALPAGPTTFVGTAWAPPHGVAEVHVRVDQGDWAEAELAAEINGDSWRRWRTTIDLEPGRHAVEARCVGADGTVQAGTPVEPFPLGSGAYHRVECVVG